MTDRWSARRTRLANAMAFATAACLLTALVLIASSPAERVADVASIRLGEGVAFGVTWIWFSVVGAIIVRHHPDNMVGWLCIATGSVVGLVALSVGIATFLLTADAGDPIGHASAWVAHTGTLAIVAAPLLIVFRFPTGRSLGPWWRGAEIATVVVVGFLMVLVAVDPMPLLSFPTTPNPLGLGDTSRLSAIWFAPAMICAGLAVASLFVRYRQGSPLERRQLRLVAAASVLVGSAFVTMPLTSPELVDAGRLSTLTAVINAIAFVSIPLAIGVAIGRDHLYDIDRIVNRTLVYVLVSAVLAGVYGVTVVGLSALLAILAPDAENTLATAGSTLVVAALFRPVRARAQRAIDRRFNRERYEATRIIEAFAGQVRAEVELDAIVGDLRLAAAQTVHPSSTACWIRGASVR